MSIEQSARTMFARHKLGGTEGHIRWLRENEDRIYIAINWDDSPSVDESKYGPDGRSRAYQEVRRIRKVAAEETPVIVGAYYGNRVDDYRNSMIIGRVDPHSDVHIIHCVKGKTPVAYESERAAREAGVPDEFQDDDVEGEWVYKALPLVGCREYNKPRSISFTDYPLLSALRPRHHSFCNWNLAEEHLKAIDAGVTSLRDVEHDIPDPSDRLAPAQLEVVCNEFLRLSDVYENYAPTLPVGRTLRDVDIVGQTENGLLFAQVTKERGVEDLQKKADKLTSFDETDIQLVLFAPHGLETELDLPETVRYESVREVVESVDQEFSNLLDAMYRLPTPTAL